LDFAGCGRVSGMLSIAIREITPNTYGEQLIRTVKSLMFSCRLSVMAQQLNDSSKDYCAVMAANPGRSLQVSCEVMVLLTLLYKIYPIWLGTRSVPSITVISG
jgi:hypothetical protein